MATKKRWVKNVTTDSTHPPEGLFTKSPEEIARSLASKKVSPKGPASGMRMLTYFVNRAGKGPSATPRQAGEGEKAAVGKNRKRERKTESSVRIPLCSPCPLR
jgi:Protein of unknown function (DUF3175)